MRSPDSGPGVIRQRTLSCSRTSSGSRPGFTTPAAWDFVRTEGCQLELTTVLPGAVFGPILSKETVGSVDIIARMLSGKAAGRTPDRSRSSTCGTSSTCTCGR